MSESQNLQYGIREPNGDEKWALDRAIADQWMANYPERTLIARKLGEPFDVKELPTTPGSVIKHNSFGMIVLSEGTSWGNHDYVAWSDDDNMSPLYWDLVFDAGAES